MAVSMFAVILVPFVFTLLVLLLVKAPKVGIALIGAIVLTVAGLFGAKLLAHQGGIRIGLPGAMEWLILVVFVFVLLVLTVVKAPKAGATVIGVIIFMVLAGLVFLVPAVRHQRTEQTFLYEQSDGLSNQRVEEHAAISRLTDGRAMVGSESPSRAIDAAFEYPAVGEDGSYATAVVDSGTPPVTSPIWSEGVEDRYEADVYPSRKAAVRALGTKLQGWIEELIADANELPTIVLFQEEHERSLLWELERTLEDAFSEMRCSIEAGLRNTEPDEIGITLQFDQLTTGLVPWAKEPGPHVVGGRISSKARYERREKNVGQSFIVKPWVEDFAQYVGERPERQCIVARSRGACTSENEARVLALRDACNQVSALVAQKWPGRPAQTVSSTDILDGGFVIDQFLQSFDGMSGRIYRQAMLIDTSAQKLNRLGSSVAARVRVERATWAGMILSAVGVLLVIIVAYVFLNMATKGYYVWSLRIAGMVLAVAGVISILLVLR